MNNRARGEAYERLAALFLQEQGCRILAANYRRPTGEIDLVAEEPDGTLAFIEVKYRSSTAYGYPSQAVDRKKQQRILRTAALYLQEKRLFDRPVRFDIAEILGGRIRIIRNAFTASI